MNDQMIRVISSRSSSTTGFSTLILAIEASYRCDRQGGRLKAGLRAGKDGVNRLPCPPDPAGQVQAMSEATMTIGSDTSEATEVATVRVLRLPLVDRPRRALNIQKKLLLTWSANSA